MTVSTRPVNHRTCEEQCDKSDQLIKSGYNERVKAITFHQDRQKADALNDTGHLFHTLQPFLHSSQRNFDRHVFWRHCVFAPEGYSDILCKKASCFWKCNALCQADRKCAVVHTRAHRAFYFGWRRSHVIRSWDQRHLSYEVQPHLKLLHLNQLKICVVVGNLVDWLR